MQYRIESETKSLHSATSRGILSSIHCVVNNSSHRSIYKVSEKDHSDVTFVSNETQSDSHKV